MYSELCCIHWAMPRLFWIPGERPSNIPWPHWPPVLFQYVSNAWCLSPQSSIFWVSRMLWFIRFTYLHCTECSLLKSECIWAALSSYYCTDHAMVQNSILACIKFCTLSLFCIRPAAMMITLNNHYQTMMSSMMSTWQACPSRHWDFSPFFNLMARIMKNQKWHFPYPSPPHNSQTPPLSTAIRTTARIMEPALCCHHYSKTIMIRHR